MRKKYLKLDADIIDHPDIAQLGRTLGQPNAGAYILCLWLHAAKKQNNVVATSDVETIARWTGTKGTLFAALEECGLIEPSAITGTRIIPPSEVMP